MSREDGQLWEEFRRAPTPELKERLVRRYLPLVRYVAGRMAVSPPPWLDFEDLLSFGAMGLLDAIERFDLGRGFCFQTFAVPRIRGAILDELRRYDWISRTGREKLQRLEKTVERFARSQGVPDDEALDQALMEIVDALLKNGPQAMAECKASLRSFSAHIIDEDIIEDAAQRMASVRSSPEGREGLAAFIEKRKPNWIA